VPILVVFSDEGVCTVGDVGREADMHWSFTGIVGDSKNTNCGENSIGEVRERNVDPIDVCVAEREQINIVGVVVCVAVGW